MKHLSILIVFVLFKPANSSYCSCIPQTIEERIDSADIIFKGEVVTIDSLDTIQTVISYEDDGSKREYLRPLEMTRTKFKVIQFIKGGKKLDYVSVYTTWRCCMCGFTFRPDATYIVFANSEMISSSNEGEMTWDQQKLRERSQKPVKAFSTTICSGTDEFHPQQMDEIIRYLNSKKNSR